MKSVVVFSPSRYSHYTICATELLIRNNVQVKSIVVKKLFNPKRFLSVFELDGKRLLSKIWKKLVLRDRAYRNCEYETITSFMNKENITIKTVDEFKKIHGIPVTYCKDLNAPHVVETLRATKPSLVVFTGGGLIRKDVLECSGEGILNCHMGILPRYRGMDVVEWAILEDRPEDVGMTVHFMARGIDTGDILRSRKVKIDINERFADLRNRFEPIMCRLMVETCLDRLHGRVERVPQKAEDGKQYFNVHPRLMEIAEAKLKLHAARLGSKT
jgi:folate-dependent phosphoribosylglycinamide formyltransferase PurN